MFSILLSHIANTSRTILRPVACVLAAAFALTSVSGCALLSDQLDRAAKGAGSVVKRYCENVTVPEVREEIRTAVNKHASPHSVAVECADGGPILKTGEGEAVESLPAVAPPADDGGEPMAKKPILIIEKNPIVILEQWFRRLLA